MTIVINCITIIYLIFAIVVADDFSQYYIVWTYLNYLLGELNHRLLNQAVTCMYHRVCRWFLAASLAAILHCTLHLSLWWASKIHCCCNASCALDWSHGQGNRHRIACTRSSNYAVSQAWVSTLKENKKDLKIEDLICSTGLLTSLLLGLV